MENLTNQMAVVTGAGSGIRKAIVQVLAGKGAKVGIHKGTDPEGITLPRLLVSPAKFPST
jgi:NAD(P)-dependent dehydrogenase (short-subunit alcohol dehydrogenase family)